MNGILDNVGAWFSGIWFSAWDSAFSVIPFGSHGFAFACGVVAGAILGWRGVAIVGGVVVAEKVLEHHEHVSGKDAEPPPGKKKPRPTIFKRK